MNISFVSLNSSVRKRITALLVAFCMAASFVPAASAAGDTDIPAPAVDSSEFIVPPEDDSYAQTTTSLANDTEPTAEAAATAEAVTTLPTDATDNTAASSEPTDATEPSAESTQPVSTTAEAAQSTTEAASAPTRAAESFTQTSSLSGGFENVETDGGVVFVGTAHVPKQDGTPFPVKFVYSSSLNLNDKSLALINKELSAFDITMPKGMIYVSQSDIVSDSQLMTNTSEKQAIFAVGSPEKPTVLYPCPAYGSVEESFERLYRGNIFSITGYNSLKSVLDGRDGVTVSDDGQTASVSIVMSEDYVEKVINGRKIRILMINSELKYYFRAPKLTFIKDVDYDESAPEEEYRYPTRNTTDPGDTLTTVNTDPTSVITNPFTEDGTTDPTQDAATTSVTRNDDTTTSPNDTTDPFGDDSTTEASRVTTVTSATTSTTGDGYAPDDTTIATRATSAINDDDWSSTTQDNGFYFGTTTAATRLFPYAQPIEPRPTTTTMEPQTTTDAPTQTAPTTESTTGNTSRTTQSTRSTTSNTQTTERPTARDDSHQYEQHAVGEAYINTRRLPLNIRTGPGLNYRIINVLPKGTHLTVLDTSNPDWYMVRLQNGSVGYAYSYYIKFL